MYNKYLENEVLSADPLKLVVILYRAALEGVGAARRHLAAGAIAERSQQITRAWEMLSELQGTLDLARGGDIARNLAALYGYMQTRLIEANRAQSDAPLADVEKLLTTLMDAWRSLVPAAPPPAQAVQNYQPVSHTA